MISVLVLLALTGVAGAEVYPNGGTDLTQPPASEAANVTATAGNLTNAGSPYAAEFLNNTSTTRLAGEMVDVSLEPVAEGFVAPVMLTDAGDDSGRLFVVDQVGTVSIIDANGTLLEEPFLDVRDRLVELNPAFDERGLLSIAFHPDFRENGRVFAFYSAPLREEAPEDWNCTNRLVEFEIDPENPDRVNATSEKILMEIDKPQFNHNGGSIGFGPGDGYLYVPLGDGGAGDDNGTGHTPGIGNAQDLTKIYGKILRIDVDNVTGNVTEPENATWTTAAGTLYGIPADNPFVENESIPPEIYAYGLRNPAYLSFDSEGNLYVADAGQNLFEEVDIVTKGGNYGWRLMEGTHCFDPENPVTPPVTCPANGSSGEPLIGPVIEGGHDQGVVFVGGRVYNGTALPELAGRYVFGYWSSDFAAGNATLLAATPPESWNATAFPDSAENLTPEDVAMWSLQKLNVAGTPAGTVDAFLLGFGMDEEAEIYVLTTDDGGPDASNMTGRVWKIVPGNVTATPTPTANVTMVPGAGATATPAATGNVTITPTANVTTVPTANATTTPAPGARNVTVGVVAEAFAFNTSTITVPAGANVTMVFDNRDTGIPHNVAVYTDSSAAEAIFVGDIITGPDQVTYAFTAPEEPGTYYFRCDVHPPMDGEFVVE
ncbi:plastocyanin [Methanoculleus sediminis]|uniref:Plastocyanin n=2 Tax=Methanoculleus sediminis TaxID=1550566 RepID=A0A0H1R0K9_9EURY|nr:plastocyanin [Methanoculleus sediminis]